MMKFLPPSANNGVGPVRIAHISDPHLSDLSGVSWQQLLSKRILGYLSWRFSRRHIQRLDILDKLLNDLSSNELGHLLISGDLTHIGTAAECRQVRSWLSDLGTAENISLIPGNHDYYTKDDISRTFGLWSDYIASDSVNSDNHKPPLFPSFRQRGPLAIIGLSTALPTSPFFATGELGQKQIQDLEQLLVKTKKMGLFRIVMLHHGPLQTSNKFRKRLRDAHEFRQSIVSHGAELIVHGHGHYPVWDFLQSDKLKIPVIGAASASVLSTSTSKRSGYNLYEIERIPEGWSLRVQSRRLEIEAESYSVLKEFELNLPAA
ncbi:MAG: metallophosphoesterase [Gammaproteobacteria bacterium]|nr:metallophosphoesterase [Gammaproteobacteria bacterium]